MNETQEKIITICDAIKDILLYKNQKYGNSALEPLCIFNKSKIINSIFIRLDDKLSRIKNCKDEDYKINDLVDIIGYLVLLLTKYDIKDMNKLKD